MTHVQLAISQASDGFLSVYGRSTYTSEKSRTAVASSLNQSYHVA